jgi:linoleate 8R-lipoxygenase / 9,12-octadecadienoate 8-hydroperoxide 8R-isomerase
MTFSILPDCEISRFSSDFRITSGLYVNIILNDFVSTLVGIPDLDTAWLLDPSVGEATESLANGTPPTGNQVSCEFSLLSQWHMLMSARDEKWMQGFLGHFFPGSNPSTVSLEEFQKGISGYLGALAADPAQRRCGDLVRGADGTFDNDAPLKVLSDSTEDCAGKLQLLSQADL